MSRPLEFDDASRPVSLNAWRTIIWTIFGCTMILPLFKERRFDAPHIITFFGFSDTHIEAASLWGGRLALIAYSLLAAHLLWSWWRTRRFDLSGRLILYGAMAPCFALLLSSIFGTNPAFAPPVIVWPALFLAFWLIPTPNAEWWRLELRLAGRVLAASSILALIIVPTWAADANYAGIIPGFQFRLAGFTIHSNTLGPFMALALIIELHSKLKWSSVGFVLAELCVLMLTQSKTSLIMAAVALPLCLASTSCVIPRLAPATRLALVAWLWATGLSVGLIAMNSISDAGADTAGVDTFTGRTYIWQAVLDEWRDNIVFGYGPRIWDESMQQRLEPIIGFRALHSHNQFVELLGMCGVIGFLAWLWFIASLVTSVSRFASPHRTECFCFLIVMMIGGVSEPWFTTYGFIGAPWLLIIYCHLIVLCRQNPSPPNVLVHGPG